MNRLITACGVLLGLLALPAAAHQTYLISDLRVMRPGTENYLILRNGTYVEDGYSITRKMARDISIVMGGERRAPAEDDVDDVDSNPDYKKTFIKVVANKEGTALGGMAAIPDYIALPAEVFANYLKHEGMSDALASFSASNKLNTIRERYTKHAKAIFQVGKPLTDDYRTPLGYKVEIFLEQNPGALRVGDEASLVVLHDGKPLANQQVFASHATFEPRQVGEVTVPQSSLYALRTDTEGRARFKITTQDKWYVQLIHMQQLTGDEDADWESNWSTITFEVK